MAWTEANQKRWLELERLERKGYGFNEDSLNELLKLRAELCSYQYELLTSSYLDDCPDDLRHTQEELHDAWWKGCNAGASAQAVANDLFEEFRNSFNQPESKDEE